MRVDPKSSDLPILLAFPEGGSVSFTKASIHEDRGEALLGLACLLALTGARVEVLRRNRRVKTPDLLVKGRRTEVKECSSQI